MIKPMHIVILVIVILVVFGASKLPDIARSIGQSAKIFKKEMKELTEDDAPPAPAPENNVVASQNVSSPGTDDNGQTSIVQ